MLIVFLIGIPQQKECKKHLVASTLWRWTGEEIYLFIFISRFIFVGNSSSNKDKKLRILFSFCLIFFLLAWIIPISDALQVDILSGDNFVNCIKGLGYFLSIFCNHKKFWIAFAGFCWPYCTVICEANLTFLAFLIRGYRYEYREEALKNYPGFGLSGGCMYIPERRRGRFTLPPLNEKYSLSF